MIDVEKIITKKLHELYQEKDVHIELLESDTKRYSEEYLVDQIRILRGKIDVIHEILEEIGNEKESK